MSKPAQKAAPKAKAKDLYATTFSTIAQTAKKYDRKNGRQTLSEILEYTGFLEKLYEIDSAARPAKKRKTKRVAVPVMEAGNEASDEASKSDAGSEPA